MVKNSPTIVLSAPIAFNGIATTATKAARDTQLIAKLLKPFSFIDSSSRTVFNHSGKPGKYCRLTARSRWVTISKPKRDHKFFETKTVTQYF